MDREERGGMPRRIPPLIDIFCRVVDNYGDIGVVLRLTRSFSALRPELEIRIVIDDLFAFAAIHPAVNPEKPVQRLGTWTLVRWDYPWEGLARRRARAILETLGCGFPPHYESILFDPDYPAPAHIVNVEHLTAEPWAEEYHLLPSLSPVRRVKKTFYMPGFTPGTGRLILDRGFMGKAGRKAGGGGNGEEDEKPDYRLTRIPGLDPTLEGGNRFRLFTFTYEHDFTPLIEALSCMTPPPLVVLAASGGAPGFIRAWELADRPFPAVALPFLPQEEFDDVLLSCDFSIIRGEESLARACLAGRPFLWQAYPLLEEAHLVKVEALLAVMKPHFAGNPVFEELRLLFLALNRPAGGGRDDEAGGPDHGTGSDRYLRVLSSGASLTPGFDSFAKEIESRGDQATDLLIFLHDFL